MTSSHRKKTFRSLLALSFVAAVFAPGADTGFGNVVGGDLQNFNAVPGGIDFVTVQSSETLEPGFFNLSLIFNHAINSLPYYEDGNRQGLLNYNDALTMLDIGLGVGAFPSWEFGVAGQRLVRQTVSYGSPHGRLSAPGFMNYRLYGKWRLFGTADGGAAIVASGVFNRVRNNPYVGVNGSPIGIVEFAFDTLIREVSVAFNAGYRFRRRGDPVPGYVTQPLGNQLIGSVGASYLLPVVDTKLVVEIFGSRPTGAVSRATSRQASTAELLGGIKYDAWQNIALHAGAGTKLLDGTSSPTWRAYGGVNWAFRPSPSRAAWSNVLQRVSATEEKAVLWNINFAFGSDQVPPEAQAQLEILAQEIKAVQYRRLIVEGHTDSIGSEAFNLALSQRRAEAVRKWLITHADIDAKVIEAAGYGESRPIADNGNLQGRDRNRRVEVRLLR